MDGMISTKVLEDISFSVNQGDFMSIIGPSGAGKSTLLYLLNGIEKATSGQIYIKNINICEESDNTLSKIRLNQIGFIYQFYNLLPNYTVEENILMPILLSEEKVSTYRGWLEELLAYISLSHKRNCLPTELSGGQQQRVAIARALIKKPSIVLADEPTGNLDSITGNEILELLSKINREFKTTIVQVTHSDKAIECSNRVIEVMDGKIKEEKSDDES